MLKTLSWLGLCLALIATISFNQASASEAQLKAFIKDVQTLQANFSQQVVDESGMTLDSSGGVFSLSRPGKFRWNYSDPFGGKDEQGKPLPGQQIYSNGKHITFFDPDLETATERSLDDALEQVPTLALVQSNEELERFFKITDFGLTDGLSWVSLKPKDEGASYQGLLIGFDQNDLSAIILTDVLGNETRLSMTNVQTNLDLDSNLFEFVPDDSVDLIRE